MTTTTMSRKKAARLQAFTAAARECAMVMLDSGAYIRKELCNVGLDPTTLAAVEAICDGYIATKHDVMHELAELGVLADEVVVNDVLARRVHRIVGWCSEPARAAHPVVKALEASASAGNESRLRRSSAYILVAESAGNALRALVKVHDRGTWLLEGTPANKADGLATGEAPAEAPELWRRRVHDREGEWLAMFVARSDGEIVVIERTPFHNNFRMETTAAGAADIATAIDNGDWKRVDYLDPEALPWYCRKCEALYPEDVWRLRPVFDSDVEHAHLDCVRGTCPEGHERMIAD